MAQFGGGEAGPMPVAAPTQGLANAVGGLASKIPTTDFMDPAPQASAPMPPAPKAPAPTPTPPVMPPVAPKQAPAAPIAPPMAQAPAPQQLPAPQEVPQTGQYDDNARQQLYAELAKNRQQAAIWAAASAFGDAVSKNNGGNGTNTLATVQGQAADNEKAMTDQFDAGRKGTREDLAAYLSQKKDTRDFGLKERELGLKHEEIKASREATRASKEIALGEKTEQFNANKTRQFREEVMGGKPYQNYQTVSGMAKQVRMARQNPSAYGDLNTIYAMVKGLDPTSVVREGEIGLMREVSSLKDKVLGKLETWGGMGPLTSNQLTDVETIMNRIEQIAADNVRSHAAPTLNQAQSMKLNEREIIGDLSTGSQPAPQATPKQLGGGWTVVR